MYEYVGILMFSDAHTDVELHCNTDELHFLVSFLHFVCLL